VALSVHPDYWYVQLRFSLGLGKKARWGKWTLPSGNETGWFSRRNAEIAMDNARDEFSPVDSQLEFRVVQGRDLIARRPFLRAGNRNPKGGRK
jgi:hypothetical protein